MNERDQTGSDQTESTRVTPYELAFGEAGMPERLFSGIEKEAALAGVDAARLDHFTLVHAVDEALKAIVPAEAPADATEQYRVVLFHAFNFWRFGKRLYLVERDVARSLVQRPVAVPSGKLPVPHPACYVQLPANLFWASIAPDTPPEPVDGFFVTAFDGTDPLDDPFRHIHALMVLGIRRNRAGFSTIPFETETGPRIATDWLDAPAREDGEDFANVLPGGEMGGISSILTVAEALKLLARVLTRIDELSDRIAREEPLERLSVEREGNVRSSRLPFYRVIARAVESEES
jgi:hypothetical protein